MIMAKQVMHMAIIKFKTQSAAHQKAQDKLQKLDLLIWVKAYENLLLGGLVPQVS